MKCRLLPPLLLLHLLAACARGAGEDSAAMCAIAAANADWAAQRCPMCTEPCINKTACPAASCDQTGHVVSLQLSGIVSLPLALGSLSRLESLTVKDSPAIDVVPKNVALALTQIKELHLTRNAALTAIPDAICSLTQILNLDLSSNALTALPEPLGSLVELTQLVVSNNELHALPASLSSLTNLTYLDVSFNRLRTLARDLDSLVELEFFYANNNFIAILAEDMLPSWYLTVCDFGKNCILDDLSLDLLENITCAYDQRPDCNATSDPVPDLYSSEDPSGGVFSSSPISSSTKDTQVDAASTSCITIFTTAIVAISLMLSSL